MTETPSSSPFSPKERAVLHSLAEMFQDRSDRDQLRQLMAEGATLKQIILAYKTQRRLVAALQACGALIVLLGGTVAALKSLNIWPR